jgi:radical SAM protein with 4Fe4S-binding SPASM domain
MEKNGYDITKIAVNGISLCTGVKNVSKKEKIIITEHYGENDASSRNSGIRMLKIKENYMKMKRAECKKCSYFDICEGVWSDCMKKYGWKEFNPR